MRISIEDAAKRGWVSLRPGGYELSGPCRDALSTHQGNLATASTKKRTASTATKVSPKPKRKNDAESAEQIQLIKQFREEFSEIGHLLIHIPNGGTRRNAFEGWRLKEQGVRAGVSDLFLPVAKGGFHGLWIEFKAGAPNTAAISASQIQWIELMQQQGYAAHICVGVARALEVLRAYLIQS